MNHQSRVTCSIVNSAMAIAIVCDSDGLVYVFRPTAHANGLGLAGFASVGADYVTDCCLAENKLVALLATQRIVVFRLV